MSASSRSHTHARVQRGIPQRLLVAAGPFTARLPATAVGAAIARGVAAAGHPAPDLIAIDADERDPAMLRELFEIEDFDVRMRAAKAVLLAFARLEERTLAGSAAFEIATRARQAGVPAYAIAASDELSSFDARMLDLQLVLQAASPRALAAAGERLARLA